MTTVVVTGVEYSLGLEKVYNLTVGDYHTFFVGAEDWGFSVWAHNAPFLCSPRGGSGGGSNTPKGGKPPKPGRQQGDRMTSKDDPIQQLEEIEQAQSKVWQLPKNQECKNNQIIDSIGKSKQRAKNRLKQIRSLDDLEDLD